MADVSSVSSHPVTPEKHEFVKAIGLFDGTMIVAGSMIGSGIFIVAADIARQTGSPGGLLITWILTGILTIAAALSYGELAGMFPHAGGQYVYLREAFSPLWGFLYGWTLFLVIQSGTIAAVAVGFARFLGVFLPRISESNYVLAPVHVSSGYALSLSTAQIVAICLIALLTWTNTRGLEYGKIVQNTFTTTKIGALAGLIVLGLILGRNNTAVHANFGSDFWSLHDLTAGALFIAICVSQTGSLFSSDAWNNITFTAGEVKNPKRNVPLSLALGTGVVIALYLVANVAYLATLPFNAIANAPSDRVATATLEVIFPGKGGILMAAFIMVSTFGCANGLILAGARASYAMARDKLFFRQAYSLNKARVPAWALVLQGVWSAFLVLPRTYDVTKQTYGNLYSNLLDYVISAALIFYILTVAGIFRLRKPRPDAERPYRAFGYPVIPALYMIGAAAVLVVLFIYKPSSTWPGLVIVLIGLPVYWLFRRAH